MQNSLFGNNSVANRLSADLAIVFSGLGIPEHLAAVAPSKMGKVADFQCNGILSYARKCNQDAYELATKITWKFSSPLPYDVSVTSPGFLNFRLQDELIVSLLKPLFGESAWVPVSSKTGRRIFLDYGGPNIAKEMHVGHLRSALIGQALCNILKFCGHNVKSDVHLGDWGLQMGLTIAQLQSTQMSTFTATDLGHVYPVASLRSKKDADFLKDARECTVRLQAGDAAVTAVWAKLVDVSVAEIKCIYDRLGVTFDQWNGESVYQPVIPGIIDAAERAGIGENSDGALVVRSHDRNESPLILRTSAGAFGYAATDLAALRSRVRDHAPHDILYVVDKRQKLHFEQVFSAARRMGLTDGAQPEHVPFGTVNGKDGRPFKTRDGQVMRLSDLLGSMFETAYGRLADRDEIEDKHAVAEDVAMAAVKYGELSHDRDSSYVFDPVRFLAFEGNTGPYLQYTSVRVNRLLERALEQGVCPGPITCLGHGGRNIALTLDSFFTVLQRVIDQRKPSVLAAHLYALANDMNGFYQKNQILSADIDDATARAFLGLLQLADRQLQVGLSLLGIRVPRQM